MTAATLHPAEQIYQDALLAAAVARRRRDEAMRAELGEGKSLRAVAAEFGVSHSLVQQIAAQG